MSNPHQPSREQPLLVRVLILFLVFCGCDSQQPEPASEPLPTRGTQQMAVRLRQIASQLSPGVDLTVGTERRIAAYRQKLAGESRLSEQLSIISQLAHFHLSAGQNDKALERLQLVDRTLAKHGSYNAEIASLIATVHLRSAELDNCVSRHTPDSCIFPLRGEGVHTVKEGSQQAVTALIRILEKNTDDLAAQWLLNLAFMTLGEYPDGVPEQWLIRPDVWSSTGESPRFTNIASELGVDVCDLAGGSILEDFDNDGDLDIVASCWRTGGQVRYFRNKGDGSFQDSTVEVGLIGETGGLNIVQADYDGDGWMDFLILRGAWFHTGGEQPNSLLRNRGDGTFDDVTQRVGLYSEHPTQCAAWGDFDNDGDLDLFIGNENRAEQTLEHPCELFLNEGDGTFKEVAHLHGIDHRGFVKGIACGDYDNDGDLDLYLSHMGEKNVLYRNDLDSGEWGFTDVSTEAGVSEALQSFPTWFFDYDNDGDLDLFVGSFAGFEGDNLDGVAADYLGLPTDLARAWLYRNNSDGTFTNVAHQLGIDDVMLAMGANFGDIDNDGFLDVYVGTGEPNLHTLVPNRLYRNEGGARFSNVASAARVGHLQKGHGVSFGDIDNDGDQDIYAVMGGAFEGDVAYNALFLNKGSNNAMVTLTLRGTQSNYHGVGARIEIQVESATGNTRSIHRVVSSGGSFGASPLRLEVGVGEAPKSILAKIHWPSGTQTTHENLSAGSRYELTESGAQRQLPYSAISMSSS